MRPLPEPFSSTRLFRPRWRLLGTAGIGDRISQSDRTGPKGSACWEALQLATAGHRVPRFTAPALIELACLQDANGEFDPWPGSGPPTIKIDRRDGHPHRRLTTLHEIGHYVDFCALSRPKTDDLDACASAHAARGVGPLVAWWDAVAKTETIKRLLCTLDDPVHRAQTYSGSMTVGKYVEYLVDPWEMFARSYAQWTAGQSSTNSPVRSELREELARAASDKYPGWWREEDFEPVGHAIDEATKDLGWT